MHKKRNSETEFTYTFRVINRAHLASLTRLIRNIHGDNIGAWHDKPRGEGIQIGGDMNTEFIWQEKH